MPAIHLCSESRQMSVIGGNAGAAQSNRRLHRPEFGVTVVLIVPAALKTFQCGPDFGGKGRGMLSSVRKLVHLLRGLLRIAVLVAGVHPDARVH